jgi:hypothetical protein
VLNLSWVASWLQHLDPGPAAALTSAIFSTAPAQAPIPASALPQASPPPAAHQDILFHPFSSWCLLAARHLNKQKRHSPHIRSETQLPLPCLFYGIIVSRHGNKVFPAFEAIFILLCTSPPRLSYGKYGTKYSQKTLRLANMTLKSLPAT